MTFKNKEELANSLKIACLKKDFRLKKVINSRNAMAALRAQYGVNFGNLIYEYYSPYYSVEKYIMTYCEEIHPVPPEDSWIVPLDIIEREYLFHMLIQENLEEGDIRDVVELVNHFQQEKISVPSRVLNQVVNEPSVYQKVDYFHDSDPNGLGMLNQRADGGDLGASYMLALISIFEGGESMREGIMFIAIMRKTESLKLRRCRQKLQYILF
ncbi:hypothetical protein H5410_041055 [Solanum commersonii]|uniref:At2g35280-like TPR domain-containing protein n=1 Tax=Solanum commersonii TaxID=4109 RepID=A0A9J5XRY6_SOLCO|nr:hypothetical protein H5410_041055 [Solanum commersonii]